MPALEQCVWTTSGANLLRVSPTAGENRSRRLSAVNGYDSREVPRLADNAKVSMADIQALNGWRDVIPEYVKDYVSLNQFAA